MLAWVTIPVQGGHPLDATQAGWFQIHPGILSSDSRTTIRNGPESDISQRRLLSMSLHYLCAVRSTVASLLSRSHHNQRLRLGTTIL